MFRSLCFSLLMMSICCQGMAETGAQLYGRHCSACHGDRGNGASWARTGLNPPPRNFTSKASKSTLSRQRMIQSVTHGRPGTAMQPFAGRLNPDQIARVVDYVRSQFMGDKQAKLRSVESNDTAAKPPTGLGGYPQGLKGDASWGREFFQNNCFVCHGREGNGAGPRSRFIVPPPRNFLSQESKAFNRSRLFHAISNGKAGTVMPAWKTVLSPQRIADVAEYVLQDFILAKVKKKTP